MCWWAGGLLRRQHGLDGDPAGLPVLQPLVLGLGDPVADDVTANVIGLGLGTLARFWAIRRFIFLSPDAHVAHTERRQRRDLATQSPLTRPHSPPGCLSPAPPGSRCSSRGSA